MKTNDFGQKKILLWQGTSRRTLRRIATQLGRINRFVGDLTVPCWTDLHHLMACAEIADIVYIRKPDPYRNTIVFYAGTHDMHEAWTNDTPTYAKNDAIRAIQKIVDINIYSEFKVPPLEGKFKQLVKDIDLKIREAEAQQLTPKDDWKTAVKWRNEEEREQYMSTVRAVHAEWPSPHHCMIETGTLVDAYLAMLEKAYRGL
jgi:5'-deoxynucleotidase YfbR-like HD superfamily hydrolase